MSKSHAPATASLPSERSTTPVGVDVGVTNLAVAAPADGDPAGALVVDGEPVREQFEHLVEAATALEWAFPDSTGQAAVVAAFYHRLRAQLGGAAVRVLDYVREHTAPALVVEDLAYSGHPLWAFRHGGDVGTWLLPAFQSVLVDHAVAAGIPVAYVDRDFTTKECHECGQLARQDSATIVCTTDDCPVDEVGRDRSAALSIARRF